MRTIVCSDFHLNKNNRLDDIKYPLSQILNYAIKHRITNVTFLGDVYHRRILRPIEMRVFEKWVMSLVDYNIKVCLVIGNHDETTETNTIEYFKILKVKNVRVEKPPLISGNIYYDHILLQESKMGPLSYKVNKAAVSVKGLINRYPKVKAFILGHIHKPQVINKKPLVMHIGSIERVNFGERNEVKYFLDINNGKLKMIKLDIRPMIQYDFDLDKINEVKLKDCSQEFKLKPIVKIVLSGSKQQLDKALQETEKYRNNYYSLKIIKKLKRNKSRGQKTKISEEKTASQNFVEYSKLKKLPEKVVAEGQRLINELT